MKLIYRVGQYAATLIALCARVLLGCAVPGVLIVGALGATAYAQDFPSKPIRLIVPFPPGGGMDGVGRLLGSTLGKSLNTAFVIDNRGGSGGVIASEITAHSPPDGYTLLLGGAASQAIAPHLYKNLPYNPAKDFTPIVPVGSTPYVLVVTAKLPVKSIAELIALVKSEPGKLNYGSAGNGSTLHLTTELFKSMTGTSITHVPYKGAAPEMPDLLSGRISMAFLPLPIVEPFTKVGTLRALGVSSAKRSTLAPDMPTIAESGVPGFESIGWYGLVGPAGIPTKTVNLINQKMEALQKDPTFVRQLAGLGIEPMLGTPKEFTAFIQREFDKWGKVVKSSGAAID